MKPLVIAACAAVLAAGLAGPAAAKQNCPPGLAKKAVPCVPPGQAKKGVRADDWVYRVGDYYVDRDGFIRLRDRDRNRYRLPRLRENEAYYRDGRFVYRVNDETRRVLKLIRLTDILLSN